MPQVTSKQKRVADLIAKGLTNGQIAERLGNTEGSIEQHLVKLFRRLGVHTREQVASHVGKLEVVDRRRLRGKSAKRVGRVP